MFACAAILAVGATGVSLPAVAEATVVNPLEPVFSDIVFGQARSVGNANLRCPVASDGVNLRANTSYNACAAAQA